MCLGHVFLCASAGFALHLYSNRKRTWSYAAFAISLGHGILGLMFCMSQVSDQFHLFDISLGIVEILPFSFMIAELHLMNGDRELGISHAYSAIIPVFASLCLSDCISEDIIDFIIVINIISVIFLGVQQGKLLYGTLAGVAAVNRFNIGKIGKTAEGLSYGLAAFCILSAYILKPEEFSSYL